MKHRDIVAQIDEHIRRMTDSLALGLEFFQLLDLDVGPMAQLDGRWKRWLVVATRGGFV